MKQVGSAANYDFKVSENDILKVQNDVQDFVIKEA